VAVTRVLSAVAGGPGLPATGAAPGGAQQGGFVDPLDLLVLRGEGVFEALRVYGGRPFRLAEHLARLSRSAAAVAIDLSPLDVEKLALAAVEAAVAAGTSDFELRIVCTKGRDGVDPPAPAAYATCFEVPAGIEADRARGLRLVLLTTATDPLVRAASPWLLPAVKSISYAVNMAVQRAANARGADDAVLTGVGGELLETPRANVWWRSGETLFTPTLALGILDGITRAALMELAGPLGWRVVEGVFTTEDLLAADEAFLSSSIREVVPVVEVEGQPIGDGTPGQAAAALQTALRELATSGPA
jgi:branched-subunit amino acid aminotransferase/4-amino-4-deoxychorismate lyase